MCWNTFNAQKWGRAIRRARKSGGYTQAEVAAAVGVHDTTIARWENAYPGSSPLLGNYIATCNLFDLDATEFIEVLK